MKSSWPKHPDLNCIHDFSDWLAESNQHTNRIYRGQAKSCWALQTSLDRHLQKIRIIRFEEKRRIEKEFIAEFRCKARKYLGDREKALLRDEDIIGSMTVMQHFGVPTRLLDWTKFGAMAAFCACIDCEDRDGAIWWVEEDAIVDSVHNEW
ncbi:MAG: FRG domain-containing protein, partial [Candidatus Hydrogenedentes bacterium]|nr:FRG domain-containing protein [Candidatus Hydrogenedentota bacterium]